MQLTSIEYFNVDLIFQMGPKPAAKAQTKGRMVVKDIGGDKNGGKRTVRVNRLVSGGKKLQSKMQQKQFIYIIFIAMMINSYKIKFHDFTK